MYADEIRIASSTASCADVAPTGSTLCDAPPSITQVTLLSNHASTSVANIGDVVTLSFTSNQAALITPTVTIAGRAATLLAGANDTWTASTTVQSSDSEGTIPFSATIGNNDGLGTTTVSSVTSGSTVMIDTTPPVLTLNGSNPDSTYAAATYTDPSASATDSHDGSVAVSAVSTINTSAAGTYAITYTATDAAGNSTTASRTVTVKGVSSGPPVGLYGSVSGSSGGGGSIIPYTSLFLVAPTTASSSTVQFSSTVASSSSGTASSAVGSVCATTSPFTKTLGRGMKGADVRRLQVFLNTHGFQIASSSDGSPGNESDEFGGKTEAALIRFQQANAFAINLVKFTGLFGEATRSYVNGLLGTQTADACASTSSSKTANTPSSSSALPFTRNLQLNASGEDVRALQSFLNTNGFPVTTSGPGSTGNETTTFGMATYRALVKFQSAHGLPASGYFGPLTRKLIAGMATSTARQEEGIGGLTSPSTRTVIIELPTVDAPPLVPTTDSATSTATSTSQ